MLRVGLTGGMGSGKSTVARIFEILGIPVYYADEAAKRLMTENEELRNTIIGEFGKEAYEGKRLKRAYLASLVFQNPEKLAKLNALIHPATLRDAEKWMKEQKSPYAIKEAALIFESGADAFLDCVIGVSAPEELRIDRSMLRDKLSREEVKARMNRQMDEDEKIKKCRFVIFNDENQMVIPQVLSLHQTLLEMAAN